MYDTRLTANEQTLYDAIRQQFIANGGRDLNADKVDYDINGAFRAGLLDNVQNGVHLPDTYKKPNHMTFSTESKYSSPEQFGGTWEGNIYTPSSYVLWQHEPDELRDYFRKNEPNAFLNIVPESNWR